MEKTVMIPVEVSADDFIEQLLAVATKEFEKRMDLLTQTYQLSLYPTQKEIMTKLHVGTNKLSEWYAMGLKKQIWSGRQIRVEREELQRFLRENFEV